MKDRDTTSCPRTAFALISRHSPCHQADRWIKAKAELTVELIKNGHSERLLPLRFDPAFWTSQPNADDFESISRHSRP